MKRFLKSALAISLCLIMLMSISAIDITASAEIIKNGICGANLTWTLDDEGTLTISGTGDMYAYSSVFNIPWLYSQNKITSVIIEDGVTSICDGAFYNCNGITNATISNTVTTIGSEAFAFCSNLLNIVIPDSVTSIGKNAFYLVSNVSYSSNMKATGKPWGAEFVNAYVENYFLYSDSSKKKILFCSKLVEGNIVIPSSVTSIGNDAFDGCTSLTSISIPDSVTSIGDYAFADCENLINLSISNNVTTIGEGAFYCCYNLQTVTIPDSVRSIGKYAFYCVNNLSFSENMKATGEPWGAKITNGYIEGSFIYSDSSKTKLCSCSTSFIGTVDIPDSVISIGNKAFYKCIALTNITIPDSVTSIGEGAFSDCSSLTSITIPDRISSINDYTFWNCSELVNFKIPDNVTSIGKYAFADCSRLSNIIIPDSVTSIGEGAFSDCSSLTSITIPDRISSINDYTFWNCSGLVNVKIPDNVTSIGKYAFDDCSRLSNIIIPDSVTSIDDYAFSLCNSLNTLVLSNNVTSIGKETFKYCSNLVIFCNKYTYALDYCISNNLDYVIADVPDSSNNQISGQYNSNLYWSIDKYQRTLTINCNGKMPTFANSPWIKNEKYFTNAIIEDGCKSISDNAFEYCHYLTNITIPESVTSIGSDAFSNCTSLTSITIPNSVTSIGSDAFSNCTSLTSITIPNSVTSIGFGTFEYCTSLTSITIPDSVTRIGDCAFEACTSLTSITIPDSVTSIGSSGFSYCKNLTSITIPNSVTSIGNYAFYNCTSLTNITIPDSVTSIGSYAFEYCTSLTEIEIPYSVKTIRSSAFSNCSALDKIYIYNRNCSISDTSAIPYNATIYGFTGSTAETFADENGYYFIAIDDTHEHTFNDSDICKLCGYDNRHDHNWSEWTVTVENNCTEDGEKYRTCSICSKKETEVIEATGHSEAEAVKENEIKATCTEDGSYESVVYCAICKAELNRKVMTIPPAGHTAGNTVKENQVPSTCVTKGKYDSVTYCSVCSAEMSRATISTPLADHTYGTYTPNGDATCTKDGTKTAVCIVCEAKNTITDKGSKLPHTDANKDGYCDVCKTVTNADLANPCRNAKINVASAKSVDYKAQVTIKATASGVPTGYSLAMYVNGKQVAKGSNTEVTYTVGQATSDINYTVKVIDAKGNVQKDSTNKDLAKDSKITVNSSFFAKIIAFFKSLFGSLSKVEVKP